MELNSEPVERSRKEGGLSIRSGESDQVQLRGRCSGHDTSSDLLDRSEVKEEDLIIPDGGTRTSEKILQGETSSPNDIREVQERRPCGHVPCGLSEAPRIEWSGKTARIGFRIKTRRDLGNHPG